MTGSSPSERISLEAHVDLCAQRYDALRSRLNRVEYAIYALIAILLIGDGTVLEVVKRLVGVK